MIHLSLLLDRLNTLALPDGMDLLTELETRWAVEEIFCRRNWRPVVDRKRPVSQVDITEPQEDPLDCSFGKDELFGQPDWSPARDKWYRKD